MAAVAQLYARAFADVAAADGLDTTTAQGQLESFAQAMTTSHDLRELMGNPSVPLEQKLRVLDSLSSRMGLGRQVRNFVAVLLQRDRMNEFHEILQETRAQMDERGGVIEAEVTSARELSASTRAKIEASIAKMAGQDRVRADYRQDASLLGGATIKIGSTIYDGSVAGQLKRLKTQLSAN